MWLQGNKIVGVEALVRWRRPDGTLVPPGEFVPVAEETGLIRPIGRWVLHEACRQLARWRSDLPQAAGLAMSVNISARQLQDASIVGDVESALRENRVGPWLPDPRADRECGRRDLRGSLVDVAAAPLDVGAAGNGRLRYRLLIAD